MGGEEQTSVASTPSPEHAYPIQCSRAVSFVVSVDGESECLSPGTWSLIDRSSGHPRNGPFLLVGYTSCPPG